MKSKAPFILILIGFLLNLVGVVQAVWTYFMFSTQIKVEAGNAFSKTFGIDMSSFMALALKQAIISGILGLVFGAIMVFFVIKTYKNPTKKSFITIIVISVIEILTGAYLVSGILGLIGGIIGMGKLKEQQVVPVDSQTK